MKKILTVFLAAFFLTACSTYTYTETKTKTEENFNFVGESEHWEAKFVYDVSETWGEKNGKKNYSNKDQYTLTFTYKGEESELATIKNITYGYETVSGSASNTEQLGEPNTKSEFKLSGSSQNSARIFPDHLITATIQWDGFEETIELNIKK